MKELWKNNTLPFTQSFTFVKYFEEVKFQLMPSNTVFIFSFTLHLFLQSITVFFSQIRKFDVTFHMKCLNWQSTVIKFYLDFPTLTVQVGEYFCEENIRVLQASAIYH